MAIKSVKTSYEHQEVVVAYLEKQMLVDLSYPEKVLCEQYLYKNDRILDVGCGTGRVCKGLSQLGFDHLLAIDISENMIRAAKMTDIKADFIEADVLALKGQFGIFDAAFALHSITSIPSIANRKAALTNIRNSLNEGGILILSAFLQESEPEYWSNERMKATKVNDQDSSEELGDIILSKHTTELFVHIPTLSDFENFIKTCSFKIIRRYDWMTLTPVEKHNTVHKAQKCTYWVLKAI